MMMMMAHTESHTPSYAPTAHNNNDIIYTHQHTTPHLNTFPLPLKLPGWRQAPPSSGQGALSIERWDVVLNAKSTIVQAQIAWSEPLPGVGLGLADCIGWCCVCQHALSDNWPLPFAGLQQTQLRVQRLV